MRLNKAIENVREAVDTYRNTLYNPATGKTFSDMKYTGKVLYVSVEVIGHMICVSVIGPKKAHENPFFGLTKMASNFETAIKKLSDELKHNFGFVGELQKREVI